MTDELKAAFALTGLLFVTFLCSLGIVSCCQRQEDDRLRKKARAPWLFLEPSDGVVDIVEVKNEYQLTVKGQRTRTALVYIVESRVTGRRRAFRVSPREENLPSMGQTWQAEAFRDGIRFTHRAPEVGRRARRASHSGALPAR